MFNNKFFKNAKCAGVSTELILSILLSVLVLFVILGIFSDNLKNMIANGNMQRIFSKNAQKTTYSNQDGNPTNTQVNVPIVAEQGLDWYIKYAQDAIAKYKAQKSLTDAEVEDLAKALTIGRICKIKNIFNDCDTIGVKYGIQIYYFDGSTGNVIDNYVTKINNANGVKQLSFKNDIYSSGINYDEARQLVAVKIVYSKNFTNTP